MDLISGILMAGGKSRRMGQDKAFLTLKGKELYRYPLEKLEKFCSEIIISANNEKYNQLGYKVVHDEIQNIGPIGGIFSCLKETSNQKALILSCDLPFISDEYIQLLLSGCRSSSICMGTNLQGIPEALISIMDKSILPFLNENISSGIYKMNRLLDHPESCLLSSDLLTGIPETNFLNINSPDDYKNIIGSDV